MEDVLEEMESADKFEAPNNEQINTMFSFIGENGSKFYEIKEGEIRYGGCTQIFSRIVRHLNQSPYCAKNLNLDKILFSNSKQFQ